MQPPAQYQQQGGGWQPQQQPPQQPQQGGGWPPQQQPPGGGWGGQQQPPPGGGGYGYEGPPLPPERNWMLIGGLIAGGVSCLFVVVVAIIILLLASDGNDDDDDDGPIGQPTVTILSPSQGQVFNVGDRITVQAQITDPGAGITRVQLLVNNVQFDNQVSQNPNGDQNMSVLLDYENTTIPSESLPLIVRAFRAGDAQGYDASVTVSVRASTQSTATPQPGSTSAPATQAPAPTQAPFNPTCRARVDVEGLRFRRGPSTDYEIISSFRAGLEVPLVGRLGDNSWWEVTSGGQRGWVSAQFTTLLGSNTNCANIPISTPPASPTPVPSPTTAAQALPNLVISTLSGANNIVFTGGQVSATYILRVRNAGNAPAGAFNITITYPDGRVSDFTVASLAPNQEIDVPNVTATYTAIGTYRLSVLVDSSGNITESNKNDNSGFLDIIVSEPTPTPEGQ